MTNKLSTKNSLKMAERSESKSAKRSFASKKNFITIFDAKLRFALSFAEANFIENKATNFLAILPAGVKKSFV